MKKRQLVWVHEPMKSGQALPLAHLSTCPKPTVIKTGLEKHQGPTLHSLSIPFDRGLVALFRSWCSTRVAAEKPHAAQAVLKEGQNFSGDHTSTKVDLEDSYNTSGQLYLTEEETVEGKIQHHLFLTHSKYNKCCHLVTWTWMGKDQHTCLTSVTYIIKEFAYITLSAEKIAMKNVK